VAERCRVDTPQGLAVEPGREEPTLKVSSDSFFLINSSLTLGVRVAEPDPALHLNATRNRAFRCSADQDPAPHQSDANLRPLVDRPSKAPF
jgi:hypothetical protein